MRDGRDLRATTLFSLSAHKQQLRRIIGAYDSAIIRAYSFVRFTIININILNIIALCLRGKSRVLDLGCGFGLFGCYLGIRYPLIEYHGYDFNSRRVAQARRAAARLKLANVRFDCADARDLEIDGRYDAVMMVDLLHHISHPAKKALLAECTRHVAPRGHLVIKDVVTRPFYKLAFTWTLDVLMTRSLDMWYFSEEQVAGLLSDSDWDIEMLPISDPLPYPHVVYLCARRGWAQHAPI